MVHLDIIGIVPKQNADGYTFTVVVEVGGKRSEIPVGATELSNYDIFRMRLLQATGLNWILYSAEGREPYVANSYFRDWIGTQLGKSHPAQAIKSGTVN